MKSRTVLIRIAASALMAAAAPAGADWLVTRDGQVIETVGSWRARSVQTKFFLPDGSHSTIPTRLVDIQASRRLTLEKRREKAAAPPPPPPAEVRTSVLRITDADVRHVGPTGSTQASTRTVGAPATRASTSEAEPTTGSADGPATGPAPDALRVLDWRSEPDAEGSGAVITGEIQNVSRSVAGNIELVIDLAFDDEIASSVLAVLSATTLRPGQKARFRAPVESEFQDAVPELVLRSDLLDVRAPNPAAQ